MTDADNAPDLEPANSTEIREFLETTQGKALIVELDYCTAHFVVEDGEHKIAEQETDADDALPFVVKSRLRWEGILENYLGRDDGQATFQEVEDVE
jgi:hypothetical protein